MISAYLSRLASALASMASTDMVGSMHFVHAKSLLRMEYQFHGNQLLGAILCEVLSNQLPMDLMLSC
jgi:hypothetical protein